MLSDKIEPELNWLYSRKLNDIRWEVHSVDLVETEGVWLVIGSTGIHAPTSQQVTKVADLLENQPEKMKEIDLWLEQFKKIWEDRFDNLDAYLAKLQNENKNGKNRK